MTAPRLSSLIKLSILVAFLLGVYLFFFHTETGRQLRSIERIETIVNSAHPFVSRLIYVAVYIVGTVLLLPGTVMSFVGAYLFGVWQGTLLTWIGATIGATLAFLVAKALGRDFVNQLLGGRLKALDERLSEHGFTGLLLIRLVPVFPFNGVNFGAGLTGIRLRDYVLGTALGILPGTFIYQYLFATLGRKVIDEGFAWEDLAKPDVLLALAAFAAFIVVTKWLVGKTKSATGPKPG